MTEKEYIQKMKELGWDNEFIEESLEMREEARKDGIDIPFDLDFIPAPIDD